jgi:hypothetical protein
MDDCERAGIGSTSVDKSSSAMVIVAYKLPLKKLRRPFTLGVFDGRSAESGKVTQYAIVGMRVADHYVREGDQALCDATSLLPCRLGYAVAEGTQPKRRLRKPYVHF